MAERVVRVTLAAQVSQYIQGMEQARRATENAKGGAEDAAAAYERQNHAMTEVGIGLAAAGAVALTATTIAVKAASSWESAWAGVTKTVDGTPQQLSRVEQGLRDLTGVLPAAHTEIAAVAEAAGQLGISTDNVVSFTRTMIDLGETTNLSANDAATALARFMNIMGTSQNQVSNLGSALVGLGNNFATTESEILDMSMRLAGAGKQIGLSEGEVLGLAAALSSVGIEAEAGGSAVSKVMIDIASSVESGGDRLEKFAKVSGMSAKDFAAQWRSDPGKALAAFVSGLADAESQGSSTLGVLEDLGITEIRMRDALLRSSAAADQFAGAMARGNEEFGANNALTEEAAKRYATVESKLAIMSNRVNDAAIDFGAVFLPAVGAVAEAVGGLADLFNDMPVGMQQVVAGGVALAGVAALAGGAFLIAVPKIAAFAVALQTLSTSQMPAVAAAAQGATTAIGRTTAGLSAAARFLTGPWGLALAAAAVGVGVLQQALQNLQATSEEMQNSLRTAKSGIEILDTATKGMEWSFFRDVRADMDDMSTALVVMEERHNNWLLNLQDIGKTSTAYAGVREALDKVGAELATLASIDGPAAAQAFKRFADGMNLSEKGMVLLLKRMPEYQDALLTQASIQGVNIDLTDDNRKVQELLNFALEEAAPVAVSAADAYMQTAAQANALAQEVLALVDAVNASNTVGQDAISANARWQEALVGVAEQADRTGTSLDQNTASGSANAAMLAGVAGSAQAAAAAQLELDQQTMSGDAAAQAYYSTLVAQREAFIASAIAAGYDADEVWRLADQVFKLPSEKEIQIVADTSSAWSQVMGFVNGVAGIVASIAIGTSGGKAGGGIIPGPPSNVDNRIYALATGEFVTRASQVAIPENRRALEYMNAGGVIKGYANGGYVQPQYVQASSASRAGGPATVRLDPDQMRDLSRTIVNQVVIDQSSIATAANAGNAYRANRGGY